MGQQIQVKNKASKRVVMARVISSNQVQVVM
jgi:flagella basal body P-ring formation protein FlgA